MTVFKSSDNNVFNCNWAR